MKNTSPIRIGLILAILFMSFCLSKVNAQLAIVEAVRFAAKKVIKAVDLKVQRWQNDVLDAQNLQRQFENALAKLKLKEIADWTSKQKEQYQQYFDELWKVKSLLTYYHRYTEIIDLQKQIVKEYAAAYQIMGQRVYFTDAELAKMERIYNRIISESLTSVDNIIAIMKSFTVQMSDAERLELINTTAEQLETYLLELREFNRDNQQLRLSRAKSAEEIKILQHLYNQQ